MEINTEHVLNEDLLTYNEDELKKTSPFYVVNNRIMNIGIIGKGFVGSAVYNGLGQIHKMSFHDPKYNTNIQDIKHTEIVFICVPTNMNEDGTCNTTIVELVLKDLFNIKYQGTIAIKSTVIPGTTENFQKKFKDLNICCVPEFLRERSALKDFTLENDVLIIGTSDDKMPKSLIKAYGNIPKKVRVMTPTEAELCKYFNNVFNALRITFANGFYDVCKELGADYQNIYDAVIQRSNIDGHYLRASENIRGFGGYCLPKDTFAFAKLIDKIYDKGFGPRIFNTIVEDNKLYKRTVFQGMRK